MENRGKIGKKNAKFDADSNSAKKNSTKTLKRYNIKVNSFFCISGLVGKSSTPSNFFPENFSQNFSTDSKQRQILRF